MRYHQQSFILVLPSATHLFSFPIYCNFEVSRMVVKVAGHITKDVQAGFPDIPVPIRLYCSELQHDIGSVFADNLLKQDGAIDYYDSFQGYQTHEINFGDNKFALNSTFTIQMYHPDGLVPTTDDFIDGKVEIVVLLEGM